LVRLVGDLDRRGASARITSALSRGSNMSHTQYSLLITPRPKKQIPLSRISCVVSQKVHICEPQGMRPIKGMPVSLRECSGAEGSHESAIGRRSDEGFKSGLEVFCSATKDTLSELHFMSTRC
jgi:hypothetical protein